MQDTVHERSCTPVDISSASIDLSTTRSKRAKYTSKACEYCHRRKIKCNGESPCAACRSRDIECVKNYVPVQRTSMGKKRKHAQQGDLSNTEDEDDRTSTINRTTTLLLERVSGIEMQLNQLFAKLERHSSPSRGVEQAEGLRNAAADGYEAAGSIRSGEITADPDFGPSDELSYIGETSIRRTLQQVEDSLHKLGLPTKDSDTPIVVSPSSALLADVTTTSSSSLRKWVLGILDKHQLRPHKVEWDILLDLYCEDVYPLYPFLHLPSLRRSYAQLMREDEPVTADRESFAQVLVCLALGRCTTSVRAETSEGTQSSGWAFYATALECVKKVVDPLRDTSSSLASLQVLTLMIIYLIRIDANERAQKILSLTIVQAQHLGLHREMVLKNAPKFLAECSRRLWWCLYILDRRLALAIGQPFVIQDTNTDTNLPLLLSETALEDLFHRSPLCGANGGSPVCETADDDPRSPIPYLISMTGYSKIVGKAWNELYQAHCMDRAPDHALTVSFEDLLSMWKQGLPPSLACDEMHPYEDNPPGAPIRPGQLKNKFLIVIRILWLRILIRKPMCSRSSPIPWIQNFDNEAVCISLADRIVAFYSRIFEPYRVYTFPFIEYLLGAASTTLGLIIKVPVFRSRHTHSVIQAAQMMNTFCKKTWVSGKTLRSIKRFTDMMTEVVNQNTPRTLQLRNTGGLDGNIVDGASNVISGKPSVEGAQQQQNPAAAFGVGRRTPASSSRHGPSDSVAEQSRATNYNAANVPEGDTSSYCHTIISPPYGFFDVSNLGPGLDSLSSFAPDLENLVMADYPFERSVSDRNLMQGSGHITYEDIAAAIY